MKTIKQLINENFYTKKGELKVSFASLLACIADGKNKFYGKRWHGKGASLSDAEYNNTDIIMHKLGINHEHGNDAPRGGLQGDYIVICTSGKRRLVKWRSSVDVQKDEYGRILGFTYKNEK